MMAKIVGFIGETRKQAIGGRLSSEESRTLLSVDPGQCKSHLKASAIWLSSLDLKGLFADGLRGCNCHHYVHVPCQPMVIMILLVEGW